MIKEMFHSVPARPVLFIVPIVIILCLGFYYNGIKSSCTKQATMRSELIQSASNLTSNSILTLADIIDFEWDKVQIFNDIKPGRNTPGCLFEWDWSDAERKKIIDAGLMSVLVFANKGRLVEYIEFRADQLDIKEEAESLTPKNAIFRVVQEPYDDKLQLVPITEK